jgi:bacillithiol biosynthesis deacetylase BshB1
MNILVVGPHPDDQELGMGGTIALLVEQGHSVTLMDMSNGEPTPHGDPVTRAVEASNAATILGVERVELGLPNRQIEHSIEARHLVAGAIRTRQIDWIFTPYFHDAHPDHVATTRIVEDARFDAKLTKTDLPGEPRYPSRLVYYFCTHLKIVPQPSFIVDTSGFHVRKRLAILAYESQFVVPEKNRGIVDWIDASSTFYGSRIGTENGEPFFVREPLGINTFNDLI